MKKRDLKKAYGEVPQSFHNSVVRTLNSLKNSNEAVSGVELNSAVRISNGSEVQNVAVRPRKNRFFRTAIACALIVAIGAVGVVSAKAIYPMTAKSEGNYGLNIELEPMTADSDNSTEQMSLRLNDAPKTAPEYVKLIVDYMPEGVIPDEKYELIKFSLNGEHEEKCITLLTERVVEKNNFTDFNVVDYEELDINGNKAILANVAIEPFSRRFYIYFEKEAAFVTGYVTSDVTEEELNKVMEGISVTECTAEDSNVISLSQTKENLEEEKRESLLDNVYSALFDKEEVYDYSEVTLEQKLSYNDRFDEENGIEFSIDKIEVLDNISGLDYNNFDSMVSDELNKYVDENGNFVPYEREIYEYGDGIEKPFTQVMKTDTVKAQLVYATVTITNTSDEEKTFVFQQFDVERLQNNDGQLSPLYAEETDGVPRLINYLEVNYIDNNNTDKDGYKSGYNFLSVAPNTTETVHIGFLADEDVIDNLYITMDNKWNGGAVFNPDTSAFETSDNWSYYNSACVKVK